MSSTATMGVKENHHYYHQHHIQSTTASSSMPNIGSLSTNSATESSSSTAIYIEDECDDTSTTTQTHSEKDKKVQIQIADSNDKDKDQKELHFKPSSSAYSYFNQHNYKIGINEEQNTKNNQSRIQNDTFSIFSSDSHLNYPILATLSSPWRYYHSNLNLNYYQNPFTNQKYRDSDCPSDYSNASRRKKIKNKKSKLVKLISWIKYLNKIFCVLLKYSIDFIIISFNKLQKWQKDIKEAPLEVKEKYFFVISTIISTVLFYLLFLCLDFMIIHWFALPSFITEYSFSISYCISYLTSVVWQHFFNQYFVFALINHHRPPTNDANDTFCDSLFRTYLVYGFSLLITGFIGSLLQFYCGIADEFVLFLTLPMSGVMNYYLLRYCHNKQYTQTHQMQTNHAYQLLATNDNRSSHHTHTHAHSHNHRHKPRHKYSKSTSNIQYHHHSKITTKGHINNNAVGAVNDDIIIV